LAEIKLNLKEGKMSMRDLFSRLTPPYIIQGGMGIGVSLSGLASAIANAGGIGIIATAGIGMDEPDFGPNFLEANMRALRKEIRKAREATEGFIGVNIMVALTNFADMVRISIEEGVDLIISGAGLPTDLPKYLKEGCKTKLVPIVSSWRAAKIICQKWLRSFGKLPDAFVVEGPLAGGHLGFSVEQLDDLNYALEKLVPEVLEAVAPYCKEHHVEIPVIAAGGIYTGADIHKFIQLGAAGVQMATRFVATHECDADIRFKQTYIDAKKEDLVIIKSPVGLPGRAIRNEFIDALMAGEKKPFKCPFHCIKTCELEKSPYCISLALINAKRGKLKGGFPFAGANAYRVKEIVTVKELMTAIREEYRDASQK
jgi:nitronate monooxygenase